MEKIIKKKDKQFLWHPFTKINNQYDPIVISSAKNDILKDINGNEVLSQEMRIKKYDFDDDY